MKSINRMNFYKNFLKLLKIRIKVVNHYQEIVQLSELNNLLKMNYHYNNKYISKHLCLLHFKIYFKIIFQKNVN